MKTLACSYRQVRGTLNRRLVTILTSVCLVFLGATVWAVQDDGAAVRELPSPMPEDGQHWYGVESMVATYFHVLPDMADLAVFEPQLGETSAGYVPMRSGVPAATFPVRDGDSQELATIFHQPFAYYSDAALRSIADQMRMYINEEIADYGYEVAEVVVDPEQIDLATGRDLRSSPRERLRFLVAVDGPYYPVTEFRPAYYEANPGLPTEADLMNAPVSLYETAQGFAGARASVEPAVYTLAELQAMGERNYSASGILAIAVALAEYLNKQDVIGVSITPDPDQLGITNGQLEDLRNGESHLNLIVLAGKVTEVRTLASGTRIADEDRLNNPLHERIVRHSPVMSFEEGDAERSDILRKSELDEYIFRLNRHPGRRVDLALSAGADVGGVTLDYLVAENKPLFIYGQISNTGTRQTDRVRERFGIINNQLTNHDDLLNIDFVTTGFDESNAVLVSYESRVGDSERWRYRVNGSWSEYTASEVGFADEQFKGESWGGGAGLVYNFHQRQELFLDLVFGVRYQDVEVSNSLLNTVGETGLVTPHVGVELQRDTETESTRGRLMLEYGIADADSTDLNNLGRLFPDDDWLTLVWDFQHSFYLEPLFNNAAWRDVTTPESSTLAHEIAFAFRGQQTLDDHRLIPQAEQVAGGLYSVRGYPESVAAGDSVYIASLEYRFHVPRAFQIDPDPVDAAKTLTNRPFRFAPQQIYGRPDWDLILRAFVDVGQTKINDAFAFEFDETLVGTGIGVELQLRQNLNLRVDWGFALEALDNGEVNSGSNRVHAVATLIF